MKRLTGQGAADAAKGAYDDAQSTIKFSNNKLSGWIAAALVPVPGTVPALMGASLGRYFENKNWSGKTQFEMITQWAQLARGRHWGNCGEYTALAFEYLKAKDVGPVDYMYLRDGDHAFCVMGRPQGTDDENASTWTSSDVWIIDGWKKLCFEMTAGKFGEVVEHNKYASYARYY
jgi:hypothetical protein